MVVPVAVSQGTSFGIFLQLELVIKTYSAPGPLCLVISSIVAGDMSCL